MQTTEKVDKPAQIVLGDKATMIAIAEAVRKKSKCTDNNAAKSSAKIKQTVDSLVNLNLEEDWLPEKERITRSLLKVQEIMDAADLLWPSNNIATKVTTDAVRIINQVYKRKFSFCNGKSSKCIAGGLFYLLSFRYNDPKKQREIAVALQITDVSIRSFYKKWINEFPELFQDIITKESYRVLR
jgi:hypothetical protein